MRAGAEYIADIRAAGEKTASGTARQTSGTLGQGEVQQDFESQEAAETPEVLMSCFNVLPSNHTSSSQLCNVANAI